VHFLVARRHKPDAVEGDAEPPLARAVFDRRVEVRGAAHVLAQEGGFDLANAQRLSRPNPFPLEDRQNGPSVILVSRQSGHLGYLPVRRTYARGRPSRSPLGPLAFGLTEPNRKSWNRNQTAK
jgi:hypothetical protein